MDRIQKILSTAGVCSRRLAEEYLRAGRVTVNGETAGVGAKADPAVDEIRLDGKTIAAIGPRVYLMLNKPRGYVTTLSDEFKRPTVIDLTADCGERIFPIGRLDRDSDGLLLLTNDGDLIQAMMRGSGHHEKEYVVKVDRELSEEALNKMTDGIYLKDLDITTKPCKIEQTGKYTFRIILTQGLNRQVRRMCAACGYQVKSLKRIRVMHIVLGDLKPGEYVELSAGDVERLYRDSGVRTGGNHDKR